MSTDKPTRILVVDDEPEIRALLRTLFEREGFTVLEAKDGAELFATLEHHPVDLVTLDLTLGREDGLMLAGRIRAGHDVAIIMITGKDDTIDRVVGLELGADDYIAKPFHLREVLARVRAVLRRKEAIKPPLEEAVAAHGESYRFAGWHLDVPRRQLSRDDGSSVELTSAEFNLLLIFVQRPSRVLSRDVIMDLLKGHDWSAVDRTIDNLVGRLRKKLELDSEQPQLIKTVRGVGYVFAGVPTRS